MNKLVDNPLVKNEMLIEPDSVKEGLIAHVTSQAARQGDVSNFQRLLNPKPVNDALLVERNRASNNVPANKLNTSTSYGDSQLVALNRVSAKSAQKEEGNHYSAESSVLTEHQDAEVQMTKTLSQSPTLPSNLGAQTQSMHAGISKTDSKTYLVNGLKDAASFGESQLNPTPVSDALQAGREGVSNNDLAKILSESTSWGDSQLVALNRVSSKRAQKEEGNHYSAESSVLTEHQDIDVQMTKTLSQASTLPSNLGAQTQTMHAGMSKTYLVNGLKDAASFGESQLNPTPVSDALLAGREGAPNNDPARILSESASRGDSQLVAANHVSEKRVQKEVGNYYSAEHSVLTKNQVAEVQAMKAVSQPHILSSNLGAQTQIVHEGMLKADSKTYLVNGLKDAASFGESQLARLHNTSTQGVQNGDVNRHSADRSVLAINQTAESLPIQALGQLPILPDKGRVQSPGQTPPQLKALPSAETPVSVANVTESDAPNDSSADSGVEHDHALGEGSVNPQTDVGFVQVMPMAATSISEGATVKPGLTKDAGHQSTTVSQISEILVSSLGAGLATVAAESKRFMKKLGDAAMFGEQLIPVGHAKERVVSGELTNNVLALDKRINRDLADKPNAKLHVDKQDLEPLYTKGGMNTLQQDINPVANVEKLSTSINELDALVKKITQHVLISDAQNDKSAVQFTVQDGLLANSEIRIQRHLGEVNIVFRIPEGFNPSMMESLHGQLSRHLSEQLSNEIVSLEFEASADDDHSPDDSNAHQDQQQSSDDPFTWVEEEEDNS